MNQDARYGSMRQSQRALRRAGVVVAVLVLALLASSGGVLWSQYRTALGGLGGVLLLLAGAALVLLGVLVLRLLRSSQRHLRALLRELRTTATNLRDAQQIAHMGYWTRSLDDHQITLTPELSAVFDGALQPGRHDASALTQLVPEADRPQLEDAIAASISSGLPFDIEHRVWLGDKERVMRTRGGIVTDSSGRPCLAGTSQDISGPAAARERLRAAEAQYRLLFDRNPLPMWIYDADTLRFLAVNDAALAHYGYSEQEFLERSILDIRPAEDARDAETVARDWSAEDRRGRVWRHLRRDGSQVYASVYSTDISFDGHPARLALVQDVTDRVRAEEDRARSELRFSIVARAASDAIYDWDLANDALWWSDGFYDIFGYAPASTPVDSIEGWAALLHPEDRDEVTSGLKHALANSVMRWQAGYRFRRADGSYAQVEDRGHILRDADGTVVRMIGGMLDVSARRADEERLHQAQAELAHRAAHDALTGLPNRALVTERLSEAIAQAAAGGPPPLVVFVGLDHFKLINDTLGHAVGDRVLCAVAERLLAVSPDVHTVARFGGDEFVLLCAHGSAAQSHALVSRIGAELSQPLEVMDTLHYLTPSIGYGVYPDAGEDADALLRNVDLAMYQAKQRGRNNAVRYAAHFSTAVGERLRLVSRLRRALANSEFELHFQPKFHASDLGASGLEALLRWNDPDRGMVAPADFIGVAEDSGLIVPIGRWVLREAARHHARLVESGFGALSIAVNVAPPQFQSGELLADLRALVESFALPRGALEIELTEGVILDQPEAAIEQMQALRALGVTIAIDDFGTGYSSLGYLRRLPVDSLKIDRSFIADLDHDRDSAAVCAAIIRLAHDLGRGVIAEGVETAAQLAWLRAHQCDGVQGFLLARPMPFEQAVQALAAPRAHLLGD